MRRLFSISAIMALLLTQASPLVLAATCEHGRQMAACHGTREQTAQQKPHCEMMRHHEAAEETSLPSERPVAYGTPLSQDCPMNCCQLGDRTNAIALTVSASLPQPMVADRSQSFASAVFSRIGFSSHTDRGPPSA